MMETIESFCDRHGACRGGRKWALKNCSTMSDVWERAIPEWLVWVATRPGVVDAKTLRLFVSWCMRQVWRPLDDYTNGEATEDELTTVRGIPHISAWEAAWDIARERAKSVRAVKRAAAWAAVWNGTWAAYAKWLRENAKPNFKVVLKNSEATK